MPLLNPTIGSLAAFLVSTGTLAAIFLESKENDQWLTKAHGWWNQGPVATDGSDSASSGSSTAPG